MEELAGSLILTAIGYLLVPIIFIKKSLDTGKDYPIKKIKKIITINSAVVWFIFRIIQANSTGEPGTGASVILWWYIQLWIMKKVCMEKETENHDEEKTED